LDSRVVELTKAHHPILVIPFSPKPLFFKSLKIELRAWAILPHKTPESNKSVQIFVGAGVGRWPCTV